MNMDRKVDKDSLKYPSEFQSMEALIGNIASAINEPEKHKCKKIRKYMQAFILDLMRSISDFELFISPLYNLEDMLKIWDNLQLKIPILSEIKIKTATPIKVFQNDDTAPILLV